MLPIKTVNTSIKYYLTSGFLGLGWFGILWLGRGTRMGVADLDHVVLNLSALVITSLMLARLLRNFISRSRPLIGSLWSLVIPFGGCLIYLTIIGIGGYAYRFFFGGSAMGSSLFFELITLYAWGLFTAALSYYVVGPYGLFCYFALRKVAT